MNNPISQYLFYYYDKSLNRCLSLFLVFILFSLEIASQNISSEDSLYILKLDLFFASTLPDTVKLEQIAQAIVTRSALDSEYPFQYFEKAKNISDRIDMHYWRGRVHNISAILYSQLGDKINQRTSLESAFNEYEKSNRIKAILSARLKLVDFYASNGKQDLSLQHAYEALVDGSQIEDVDKAQVHHVIADLYMSSSNEDLALEQVDIAREIYQRLDMQRELAQGYESSALMHMRRSEFVKALIDINIAIDIAKNHPEWGVEEYLGYIQNRGQILGDSGKYMEALAEYDYVNEVIDGVDSLKYFYFFNSHKQGTYTFRMGQLERSKKLHLKIVNNQNINSNPWKNDAYAYLSMIYDRQGKLDSAYKWHILYADSVNHKARTNLQISLNNIKKSYETNQKELLIKAQKKEIRNTKAIRFLGLFTIGILGLLFFQSIRNSRARKKSNDALEVSNSKLDKKNKQNETLLKEIHHRVKNNLQTISSLLYLQSYNIQDTEVKNSINVSQQRVESMALIHKSLYQTDDLSSIELKDYFKKLLDNLSNSYDPDALISLNVEMEPIEIDVDTAIPLGLIVNELVTNSFKYAFPNKVGGEIVLRLESSGDKHILIINDNGIGKGENVKESFGTQLISLLCRQIGGSINQRNDNGYWFEMVF